MIRSGTTPIHFFNISIDPSRIKTIKITYAQGDIKITKHTDDCTIQEGCIVVSLSQEDTLSLDYCQLVEIQIRILTKDDKSLASNIMRVSVAKCLDKEVLV